MYAEPSLGKAKKFYPSERIESQIEFDVHGRIQCANIRFGFPHQFCDDRSSPTAQPCVIGCVRLPCFSRLPPLCLFLLDFEPLELASDRPGQGLVPNSQRMD